MIETASGLRLGMDTHVKKKILIWDVECTDLTLEINQYDLKVFTRRFDPKYIKRDWTLLGAAVKWLDDDKAHALSVRCEDPLNDEGVVKALHHVLDQAEVLIGHNSDAFDLKKFNARAISYGLPPLGKKVQIDTLKMARKYFKFTSNKLSYIADFLGLDLKDNSPDWNACKKGCPDALRYMRKYNKQDVIVTAQIYKKLRAYHHTHPDLSVYAREFYPDGEMVRHCPVCLSIDFNKRGVVQRKSGTKQRFKCNECRHNWYDRKNIKRKK